MIARALWIGAISIVAVVTAAVQLDRQARVSPELSELVPAPFRAFAQTNITAMALQGEDKGAAIEEAKRLIERRPIPAEHLRLLTAAQLETEQIEQGAVTIQIAAQRGWRDKDLQEAMVRFAIEAGDEAEAARRYSALFWNPSTKDEVLLELGPAALGEEGGPGRAVFAEIIAGGARWQGRFLILGARVLPEDAFAEIVDMSAKQGAELDCRRLQSAIDTIKLRNEDVAKAMETAASNPC